MVRGGSRGAPKGDKRQRTRAALIAAAVELIGERGFDRTSLEAVAERARMSRGAIYGNFENREALFMAVAGELWAPIVPDFVPGAPVRVQLRALGEAVAREAEARLPRAAGAAAFQLYVLTHEAMRARLTATNAEVYRRMAAALEAQYGAQALPMPAERLVKVLDCLVTGLLFTYFQTPQLIGRDDFIAAFEALA